MRIETNQLAFIDKTPGYEVIDASLQVLQALYPYPSIDEDSCKAPTPEDRVLSAVQGSSRMRMRGRLCEQGKQKNLDSIQKMMEAGRPICIATLYGTAKVPNSDDPRDNLADLADFSAFHTYLALDQRVRAVYPQGIKARVYYEDYVGAWLFGNNLRVDQIQESYFQSLLNTNNAIAQLYGGTPISIVKESEILKSMGLSRQSFLEEATRLQPKFEAYLRESDVIMEQYIAGTTYKTWVEAQKELGGDYECFWETFASQHLKSLSTLKVLVQENWAGFIPPEMRSFYFVRFKTNAQGVGDTYDELIAYLARYEASALTKVHLGCSKTCLSDEDFDMKNALKLSFIKFPPGIPPSYFSVLEMRAIFNCSSRGGTDTCAAPWRIRGGLLFRPDQKSARIDTTATSCVPEGDRYPADVLLGDHRIKADIGVRTQ